MKKRTVEYSSAGTDRKKTKGASPLPRPPRWLSQRLPGSFDFQYIKNQQVKYLQKHSKFAEKSDWNSILIDHFDWWQFPIDDGSRKECNLRSESDVEKLLADEDWLRNYRDSLRIVSYAFGWDIDQASFMVGRENAWKDIALSNRDVRLYKMIRSVWLLKQEDYLESLRKFARLVDSQHHHNEGFWYGSLKLSDIHHMYLPRPAY